MRQAIAIQGALRERGREYDWLTLYIDTQTQQPLYVITERRRDRRRIGVGILLHRWSGDQPGYPAWPEDEPAAVFDPAAAVFFDESDGSGWRRESYDARSTPLSADELRYRTTSAFLRARSGGLSRSRTRMQSRRVRRSSAAAHPQAPRTSTGRTAATRRSSASTASNRATTRARRTRAC